MKIIRPGNLTEVIYGGTCENCGCKIEAGEDEVTRPESRGTLAAPLGAHVSCPTEGCVSKIKVRCIQASDAPQPPPVYGPSPLRDMYQLYAMREQLISHYAGAGLYPVLPDGPIQAVGIDRDGTVTPAAELGYDPPADRPHVVGGGS